MGGECGGVGAAMCWECHERRTAGRGPLLVEADVRIGVFKKRNDW